MGRDCHAVLSAYSLRILAHVIDNVVLVSARIAMGGHPHHYFKLRVLQGLAWRREVMDILGSNTIDLKGMLGVNGQDVIVLGALFAIFISYGPAKRIETSVSRHDWL
jgi:hypothetical protein